MVYMFKDYPVFLIGVFRENLRLLKLCKRMFRRNVRNGCLKFGRDRESKYFFGFPLKRMKKAVLAIAICKICYSHDTCEGKQGIVYTSISPHAATTSIDRDRKEQSIREAAGSKGY